MSHKTVGLKDVSNYVSDKIKVDNLRLDNYISTDNMLQNKNGIEIASSFPPSDTVNEFKKDDILISNIRPYFRKIWYADFDGGCSADVLIIRADKELILPEFLYYVLFQDKFFDYVMVGAKGVKMPRGDKKFIMNYKFTLPDLHSQEVILRKVSPITSKIDSNIELISSIQDYTQHLFYKWFVDFNFPNEEEKPYKDSDGKMQVVEDKLIPLGWEIIKLKSLVKINNKTLNPLEFPNKVFKHYSIPVFDEINTYSEELGKTIKSNKYVVNDNNILVSKLNPRFNRVIYPYNVDNAISSTEFVVLEPFKDNILETIYTIVSTNKFIKYCSKAATGTSNSHKRIKPDFITSYPVNYNEEIMNKFNHIIGPLIRQRALLLNENKTLKEFRNSLTKKIIK